PSDFPCPGFSCVSYKFCKPSSRLPGDADARGLGWRRKNLSLENVFVSSSSGVPAVGQQSGVATAIRRCRGQGRRQLSSRKLVRESKKPRQQITGGPFSCLSGNRYWWDLLILNLLFPYRVKG